MLNTSTQEYKASCHIFGQQLQSGLELLATTDVSEQLQYVLDSSPTDVDRITAATTTIVTYFSLIREIFIPLQKMSLLLSDQATALIAASPLYSGGLVISRLTLQNLNSIQLSPLVSTLSDLIDLINGVLERGLDPTLDRPFLDQLIVHHHTWSNTTDRNKSTLEFILFSIENSIPVSTALN